MQGKRIAVWVVVCVLSAATAVVLILSPGRPPQPRSITLQGAVIRHDADVRKEVPIAGAAITASDAIMRADAVSSASGYFRVTIREQVGQQEAVHLELRAPGYHPLRMDVATGPHADLKQLFVAEMKPLAVPTAAATGHPALPVSNIVIRYTVNYQTETNIGTEVRVFQAINQGNVPCQNSSLCSPDGRWKAASGSVTLDAGAGNVFHNVRASCIAGPCPFTKIDSGSSDRPQRSFVISAVDWSGTATFLVEAEVFQQSIASAVRESYPVIYGGDLHFALPPTAEGPSIEAQIDGTPIVFPLGNGLYMDWGTCTARSSPRGDKATVYQCEIKPGYRF